MELEFPLWIRLTHFFNILFISLLVRSGIEILGAHPKLYLNDDAHPGSEWARFTRKQMPKDRLWTAEDETEPYSPWLALPGKNNLGLGRHWHFWAVTGWVLTGVIYVVLLFTSEQWQRLVPTSWEVFPRAWDVLVGYTRLEIHPLEAAYNALQQLTYFLVIFALSPLVILTGIAMSPALSGRFTWVRQVFGGHQGARTIHFLGMVIFVLFTIGHTALVIANGFGQEAARIVLGSATASQALAIAIALTGIAAVIVFNVWATAYSLVRPMPAKRLLEVGIGPLRRLLFHHWVSRQHYRRVSSYSRANGRPPRNEQYEQLRADGFNDWRLEVKGLVESDMALSLEDLCQMPKQRQSTLHICIQGWTFFAEWAGVPITEIMARCRPLPEARYLVFRTLDDKWERPGHGYYYEVIDMELAMRPQTILAYEMNGEPLPLSHGAPLRLRAEGQLGYKMAKWVCGIEFVEDFHHIGLGQGGWRDDLLNYYPTSAGI